MSSRKYSPANVYAPNCYSGSTKNVTVFVPHVSESKESISPNTSKRRDNN